MGKSWFWKIGYQVDSRLPTSQENEENCILNEWENHGFGK